MADTDPSDDRDIVSQYVKDFVKTGKRVTADELAGSLRLADAAATPVAKDED